MHEKGHENEYAASIRQGEEIITTGGFTYQGIIGHNRAALQGNKSQDGKRKFHFACKIWQVRIRLDLPNLWERFHAL